MVVAPAVLSAIVVNNLFIVVLPVYTGTYWIDSKCVICEHCYIHCTLGEPCTIGLQNDSSEEEPSISS